MLTESLKVILAKKAEDLTDDDKAEIKLAGTAFRDEIIEVCRKHGFEYKALLKYSEAGIVVALDIVPIKEAELQSAEAGA